MKKGKTLFMALAVVLIAAVAFTFGPGADETYAATGTPISTVEEFLAMENDPAGSYYLANDITVPANTSLFQTAPFTGTLDGNGHKIKGYTYTHDSAERAMAGLICTAKGATFKNLTMTDVNINVNVRSQDEDARAAALVVEAADCTFTNVKVAGKINVSGVASICDYRAAGIAAQASQGTFTSCTNSAAVTITYTPSNLENAVYASGIASGYDPTFSKCTNSGAITLKGGYNNYATIGAAGICAETVNKATSCKNTGNITVDLATANSPYAVDAAGICGNVATSITSCNNSGAIKVTSSAGEPMGVFMGGVAAKGRSVNKCWNKGPVTFSGKVDAYSSYEDDDQGLYIGGVFGQGLTKINQSYNKGKVTATVSSGTAKAGGLGGDVFCGVNNCYNVGKVTLKGEGVIGGVLGYAYVTGDKVTCIYNTGKVVGKNKANKGLVIGSYGGAEVAGKRNIYNNYYKGSGKAYGEGYVTWKAYKAKAEKVSSITKKNCPKLSSKYWTYSKKYKRMILKANKEK